MTSIPRSEQLPAGSSICQVYRNLFLIPNFEFPPQKHLNLTYMITFWVRDLYTWIRTATSRIQQLAGVQKFIFDDIIRIPALKNIPVNLAAPGSCWQLSLSGYRGHSTKKWSCMSNFMFFLDGNSNFVIKQNFCSPGSSWILLAAVLIRV